MTSGGEVPSVQWLEGPDAFALLESDWRALESDDPCCTPFNTYDWSALWWRYYGDGCTPMLLRIQRGGRTIGIAPLYRRRERQHRVFTRAVVRFIGSGGDTSPDYLDVLARPEDRAAVIDVTLEALQHRDDWHTLRFSDIDADSQLDARLQQALTVWPGYHAPVDRVLVLTAALPARWTEYVAGLSRKRRKQLNHRRNRLDQAGHAVIERATTPAQRQLATDALIALHRVRWQSKGEAGGFRSEAYERFHRDVIETFAQRDALWLVTLRLDDDIIGVLYGFAWRGQLMLFQSGLSPQHERLSPGHVMFGWTIERAIEHGFDRLNLLKGDYHYKTAWARERTFTHDHRYYRPGTSALLARWRERVRR